MLSTNGRRLLIVEDDPALCENLVEVFVIHGFEVLAAETAESALDLLGREAPPDIVLLDYGLPGLNGCDLFERMKLTPPVPPTILLTGDGRAAELAEQHGMPLSVRKPFDTAGLVRLVASVAARTPPV